VPSEEQEDERLTMDEVLQLAHKAETVEALANVQRTQEYTVLQKIVQNAQRCSHKALSLVETSADHIWANIENAKRSSEGTDSDVRQTETSLRTVLADMTKFPVLLPEQQLVEHQLCLIETKRWLDVTKQQLWSEVESPAIAQQTSQLAEQEGQGNRLRRSFEESEVKRAPREQAIFGELKKQLQWVQWCVNVTVALEEKPPAPASGTGADQMDTSSADESAKNEQAAQKITSLLQEAQQMQRIDSSTTSSPKQAVGFILVELRKLDWLYRVQRVLKSGDRSALIVVEALCADATELFIEGDEEKQVLQFPYVSHFVLPATLFSPSHSSLSSRLS
jgi:hypothetical protein